MGINGAATPDFQSSLSLLRLKPELAYTGFPVVFRAPLCFFLACTVMVHYCGGSGALKSSWVAVLLAFFGSFVAKEDLPAHWSFTAASLERMAHVLKDSLLVIDDLHPEMSGNGRNNQSGLMVKTFERLLGAVGDHTGRRRLGNDLLTRPEYAPRGLIVSTGEYTPVLSTSRLARLFVIPVEKGDLPIETLSELQRDAPSFRRTMVSYLSWLRADFDETGKAVVERFQQIRAELQSMSGLHSRTPENVAHLLIGLEYGLAFLRDHSVITTDEEAYHRERGRETLCALAEAHGKDVQTDRPALRFLNAVCEGLMSGACWLADRRTDEKLLGYSAVNGSPKIGWLDEEGVYLIPDVAFDFAEKACAGRKGSLGLPRQALKKLLKREGFLVESTDSERDRVEVRKRIPSGNMRLLMLKRGFLTDVEAYEAETRQIRQDNDDVSGCGPLPK